MLACEHLDRHGLSWRIAFVSPSLGGLWAATVAGLGIAVRTPIGLPSSVGMLEAAGHGLPSLPSLGLMLRRSDRGASPRVDDLAAAIRQALREARDDAWLTP